MSAIDPNISLFFDTETHRDPGKLIGSFPMLAWKRPDREGAPVRQEIILAVLAPYDEGRLIVRFVPGSTGHEIVFFDDDFVRRVEGADLRTEIPEGEFVPPWSHDGANAARWTLCAGSPAYHEMWVMMDGMKAMVEHFKPLLHGWRATPEATPEKGGGQ
jgi:hypothetical protein